MSIFNILNYMVLLTPFLSGIFFDSSVGHIYFFYLIGLIYVIYSFLFMLNISRLVFSRRILILLFLVTFISIISNIHFSLSVIYTAKYIPPVILMVACYWLLIKNHNYNVENVFSKYTNVSFGVSIFCIIQEISYLLGSDILLGWANIIKLENEFVGVVGFSSEPSNLAVALIPAVYFSLKEISDTKKLNIKSLFIILALLLSFSALGYMGLLFSITYILWLKVKRNAVFFPVMFIVVLLSGGLIFSQEYVKRRVVDSITILSDSDSLVPYEINLSTYTLFVHASIVRNSLIENSYLGTGIGTYSHTYDSYIDMYVIPDYRDELPGRSTAASFLLKALSEFGILGFSAVLFFFCANRSKSYNNTVNQAFAIGLILIFIRLGMYYVNGIPFFFMMYYYSKKNEESNV